MTRTTVRIASAFGLLVVLFGMVSASAVAAPSLAVELENDANETQEVIVEAAAGQFRLRFGSGGPGVAETGNLKFNASEAEVQAALNALTNISTGGGSVTVTREESSSLLSRIYFVHFDSGPLAHTDVSQMTAPAASVPLSGVLWPMALVSTFRTIAISHSDERVDYTVRVKNTAPATVGTPVVGDILTCVGSPPSKVWEPSGASPFPRPETFDFEWRRNGAQIPGVNTETYTATAADEGKAIQCVVTGTSSNGSSKFASLPAVVIDPQPATPVPASSNRTSYDSRPNITNEVGGQIVKLGIGEKGVCHPPINWTAGTNFSYQWLHNGVSIAGAEAETPEYRPVPTDAGKVLQCEVIGANAGGSIVGISGGEPTSGSDVEVPRLLPGDTSLVEFGNSTAGPVTLELELPAGDETRAYKAEGSGWSCQKLAPSGADHAKAICTRSDHLAPETPYPSLKVIAALGPVAPDEAVVRATASGGGALASDSDEDQFTFIPPIPFGVTGFESSLYDTASHEFTKAGRHPFAGAASFTFTKKRILVPENLKESAKYEPVEHVRNGSLDVPRGIVGNPLAVPKVCPTIADVLNAPTTCPPGSAVGGVHIVFSGTLGSFPIYALKPEYGTPAQFVFKDPLGNAYTVTPRLRADEGYAISFELSPTPIVPLLGAKFVFCDFGANSGSTGEFTGCKKANDPGANPKPLFANPTRCSGPPPTATARIDTWEHPGEVKSYEFSGSPMEDCDEVPFEPHSSLTPTSTQADSPTGMNVEITMPSDGLEEPQGVTQASLDTATVTFPEGMAINPAAADGLGACSPAQIKLHSNDPDECPASSKVGTVEIETPLIEETLTGNVYVASQGDNPFKSTLGLYMDFDSPKDGIRIKVAGKLVPDPVTGQLTSVFTENIEDPFSRLVLRFNQGPRAPLINPPTCGAYAIHSEFSPWSAVNPANPTPEEVVSEDSEFEVTEGPNGGPCPAGTLDPKLKAGLKDTQAGSKSPFVLDLRREDGTQRFGGLEVKMPPGLTAYLKGVPYCPDNVLAGISSDEMTGRAELAAPACSAASQVGTVQAGAGAGLFPFYAPGKAYLAGPYKGAPLSIAIVTPAVAGPFDLGNVVVRNALYVNPETAQVTVRSDPIPTILHGLLLDVRDIRVAIDRPNFTAGPTNCEPMAIGAHVTGESVNGAPGATADVSNRFQVGGCDKLAFKPKLSLRLLGGTHRGAHPRLRAVLSYPPGGGTPTSPAPPSPCRTPSSSTRPTSAPSAPGPSSRPRRVRRARSTASRPRPRRCSTTRSAGRSTCAPLATSFPTWWWR